MMKRFSLLFIAAFMLTLAMQAQTLFSKGDKVVNLGIGLGSYTAVGGSTMTFPPTSASFEVGVKDDLFNDKSTLGIGGFVSYSANKWTTTYGTAEYGYKYSYTILGVRAVLHYQLFNKIDTYGGVMLGYNIGSAKSFGDFGSYKGAADKVGGFAYSSFIGARYNFTSKLGAFAEIGYGVSIMDIGISYKL